MSPISIHPSFFVFQSDYYSVYEETGRGRLMMGASVAVTAEKMLAAVGCHTV